MIFKSKLHNGFFIEAGADDLITDSNTLFFEIERSWTGILVEPALWEKRFWGDLKIFSVIFLQASDQTKRLVCPGLPWPSRQTPLCSVHGKSPRGRDGRPARGGEGGYHSVPVLSFCQVLFNIFSCFVIIEVPASLISRPAYFSPSATRPSTTSALILRAQRFRWPLLWLNKIL